MKMDAPPAWLCTLAGIFDKKGWPLYAVGGWVRDSLLGLPAHDVDLCGPAAPAAILDGLDGMAGIWAVPASMALGTLVVGVDFDGTRYQAEYTAFRRESYRTGGSHRPEAVTLGASLDEDALRRDFTVNALYMSLPSAEIIDPLGGLSDAEKRVIRTTRSPLSVFGDDGLRLLRLVRAACELDFDIDPDTFAAARGCINQLSDIVPERIGEEFCRIVLADVRYPRQSYRENPVRRALELLDRMGALSMILPEVTAGRGLSAAGGDDVLTHLMRSCAQTPPVLHLRLAALLHDIGVPNTADADLPRHGPIGADRAKARLRALRMSHALTGRVTRLIEHHEFDWNDRIYPPMIRRFFARMGYDYVRDLMALRRADRQAAGDRQSDPAARWTAILEWMEREGVPDTPDGIALNGRDIAALLAEPPSPRVGRLKRALWLHVVDHPEDNTPGDLALAARALIEKPSRWDIPKK